jgi:hypothetical protein
MSWRALPLRVVFGITIVLAVIAMHMSVAKPRLPFVLVDSFDKAWSLVSDAAERRIDEIEADVAKPRKGPTLDDVLARMDAELSVACDAATDLLDTQLAALDSLAPQRRTAALDCTLRHLVAARESLVHANDPAEFAEYDALCERLRDVRRLLG